MKEGKVIQSVGVVGSFTLLSRTLGMLRDIFIAYHFGTSMLASAFFIAFTIPNLFRRLFGEGALSAAFIPVFVETRTNQGDKEAWGMAAKVCTMVATLLTSIAIVGVLLFSMGMKLPGISEKWLATFALARVMFPYVLLICMAALSMAILNSFRHFATSAFAPCLLNLILIATMLFLFPVVGSDNASRVYALSWSVLVAGLLQVAIQLPALKRFGCPFHFSSQWNDPRIKKMLLLMGPAALGMAVTQFNVLIDRFLAMWIGEWAPAALTYSERMIYFPLGVIATAMGTVLLPTFSLHAAEGNLDSMRRIITRSLRHLVFIMTPAALGLLVLAPHILRMIFEWNGSFDAQSTLLSTRALACYAPGLLVFSSLKVLVPAFYAMQDTKTPVRIGIGVVLFNLALNITFILILPTYWKHAGIALATVIAEAAGMTALGILLTHRVHGIRWLEISKSCLRAIGCALVMSMAVWLAVRFALPHLDKILPAKISQTIVVGVAIGTGALLYLALMWLIRAPELREIKSALGRK